MIKNAFAYVTRKSLKSLIILLVITAMATLSMVGLAIKDATNKSAAKTFGDITNSFTMEINRQINMGTARGGGNIRNEDINKIVKSGYVNGYIKRIGAVADLDGYEIIRTEATNQNEDAERIEKFKSTVMVTGVNDSSQDTKFVAGTFRLVEGKHLGKNDKNKVLIHKDLAEKNNLKVGDKIKIRSNQYDADNEKQADETIEVEIKGLFDGHNQGGVSAAVELYENNIISDIDTAAKLYGNTEQTAVYQDATFFVKGDKNLDKVIKKVEGLDIDWQNYTLVKSTSNYPALKQSISGIYSSANKLFVGGIVFAGLVVSLLLFLWMNSRKKEVAVLLAIGRTKREIAGQFAAELAFITIPAYIISFFASGMLGKVIGNKVLQSVTGNIAKGISKESASAGLGGGAEVDGFNKTLTSLDVIINGRAVLYVVLFMTVVLAISLLISTYHILRKRPKELLIDAR